MGERAEASSRSARERVLAAAERLFAAQGVHGTALREVSEASGVPVNLISYHFKTKDELLRAVLLDHSAEISYMRREVLTELELRHSPEPPPLEALVASFFAPIFAFTRQDPEFWANFIGLLNRERGTPAWRETIGLSAGAMLKSYAVVLHRILPRASRKDIVFALALAFLSLILSSRSEAESLVGEDLFAQWDDDGVEARLASSLIAGLRAFG